MEPVREGGLAENLVFEWNEFRFSSAFYETNPVGLFRYFGDEKSKSPAGLRRKCKQSFFIAFKYCCLRSDALYGRNAMQLIERQSLTRNLVGMRGFEPPASRPPDAHSNRAELHPVPGVSVKNRSK